MLSVGYELRLKKELSTKHDTIQNKDKNQFQMPWRSARVTATRHAVVVVVVVVVVVEVSKYAV